MLQCVAVCCSVLQCIAVCCSALQCLDGERHRIRKWSQRNSDLTWYLEWRVAVCHSVLQRVAVRRSVLQCVAVS